MQTSGIFSSLAFLVCALEICSGRVLHTQGLGAPAPGQSTNFVSASGRSCSSVCAAPALFKNLLNEPTSYACSVDTSSGSVAGYQLGNSSTCTVASGENSMASTEYSCLCLEPDQTQGLDLPDSANSCASSCSESIDGEEGAPVQTAEAEYTCLASTEVGTTNRFGHTSGSTCAFAANGAVKSSGDFSCFCIFIAGPSSSSAAITATHSQVGTATAG